ncbi:hypothetical protein [Streptomyces sp. RFCAC02]|uniref:hypothetical protein n=1 Tax=Streptomyces sp. RFCAC02 TaxID=2499143 RepID=UPI00143DBD7F|nr:hypothetical protein [Streptomyces sp. RFCAC02]
MASILITKLTDLGLADVRVPGSDVRFAGTGASGAAAVRPSSVESRVATSERPIKASAAAAVRQAARPAYAAAHGTDAGHQLFGQQNTQLHTMWALRGLDPWSDPA